MAKVVLSNLKTTMDAYSKPRYPNWEMRNISRQSKAVINRVLESHPDTRDEIINFIDSLKHDSDAEEYARVAGMYL